MITSNDIQVPIDTIAGARDLMQEHDQIGLALATEEICADLYIEQTIMLFARNKSVIHEACRVLLQSIGKREEGFDIHQIVDVVIAEYLGDPPPIIDEEFFELIMERLTEVLIPIRDEIAQMLAPKETPRPLL